MQINNIQSLSKDEIFIIYLVVVVILGNISFIWELTSSLLTLNLCGLNDFLSSGELFYSTIVLSSNSIFYGLLFPKDLKGNKWYENHKILSLLSVAIISLSALLLKGKPSETIPFIYTLLQVALHFFALVIYFSYFRVQIENTNSNSYPRDPSIQDFDLEKTEIESGELIL